VTNLDVAISNAAGLEKKIERLCQTAGLSITMKTTSAKFPGSIHWHLKKGKERGTLEITLWPAQNKLWFSMQDGRSADWIMPAARQLKAQLEAASPS
jgi:hypothetical protein